jgi:AAA+ ATPase superfamily predicted ATPase
MVVMGEFKLIGRDYERKRLQKLLESPRSEFLAVFGRRRVGKTFLIKEFFNYKFDFYITGLANASTAQQLFNFDAELERQSHLVFEEASKNWLEAFQRLRKHLEVKKGVGKKVIFIDELPWFDTYGTDFMIGLEHFWNAWAVDRKDIMLITCGSAAAWMLNELINNTGGLHNRITGQLKIAPFTLKETEQLLRHKNCDLDRYQVVQLYMCMGGIPYYIDNIEPGMSAAQNIQALFFEKGGLLHQEFQNLYRSLFKRHELYEKVVAVLASRTYGIPRSEIINLSGMKSGGTLTKILSELEESGFISAHPALDGKQKNTIYRLSDYFSSFYFHFLSPSKRKISSSWIHLIDQPAQRAWQGFTFEQVCIDHILNIKKVLGISGIEAHVSSWAGEANGKKAQIDLMIDRRDHVINLCECKFSLDSFSINKTYADSLKSKIAVFREASKTKKAIQTVFITTYGVVRNAYSDMLVQQQVLLDDLFD